MHKYQQLQKVGSGNFSAVHLVRNKQTGQTAAMKLMKTHQNIALKQAYFLKNFDHPNIVRLLDFEQDTGRGETRIVLQYLPQNTLELYEQQQFGLKQQQVKCVLFQAALGLAYVHQRGIIHRDIKPENILIDKRKAEIKLIDFGLAVSLEKVSTDYVATRWYRAPENLLGTKEYSCLIDVFSLACVIVELYLGNPLFPGADNLDQLYRIFNILGEPTEASWPAGAKKFRQLGFKSDPSKSQKKGEDAFGLRTLLKACSEGLVSLLERMLILNPKKRITTHEIVLDPYFADVKTIIPPNIYKRFQRDHILKKTISKETIENGDSFSKNNSSMLSKIHQNKQELKSLPLTQNNNENVSNHCSIINMAISPRKTSIQEEEMKARQHDFKKAAGLHAISPKQQNIAALRPPHQQPPNSQPQSILAFRGFNPIKNNKISVKETRKNQQNHSHHKMSRDNSLDSNKSNSKDNKFISNSIDLGRKILNNSHRFPDPIKVERRITNDRQYRTPDVKERSIDKTGRVLYYFHGEKDGHKGVSPLKIIMPARQNIPIESSVRMQHNNKSILISDSTRITRNNSAINLPSVRLPDQRSIIQPKQRERISHSPGITLTQIQRESGGRVDTQPSHYIPTSRPAYEKLKILTNVTPVGHNNLPHNKSCNDRSQDHSTFNVSGFGSPQASVLRGERVLEFKEKVLSNGNRQLIPANYPSPRAQPFENTDKHPSNASISKLKQYKSVERGELRDPQRYPGGPPEKKEGVLIGQFKNVQIEERQNYREPRISAKKDNQYPQVHSPRQNNININLNVSIIDAEHKDKSPATQHKRTRI